MDALASAFGQKPSPWLPFETKLFALRIAEGLVGISRGPRAVPGCYLSISLEKTRLAKFPEHRLAPKFHNCTVL